VDIQENGMTRAPDNEGATKADLEEWWRGQQALYKGTEGKLERAIQTEWRRRTMATKAKRRALLDEGNVTAFLGMMLDKPRAKSGYRPAPKMGEDGKWKTPLMGRQVKEQSAADYAKVFDKCKFATPSFLKVSQDEAGTTSTHFGDEPCGEEEKRLWGLMMRRDGGEEGLQPTDWGELTGPLTASEENRAFRDFGGKTPGMSGYKSSMLQPFPPWMREALVACMSTTMTLRLTEQAEGGAHSVYSKGGGGYRPFSLFEELLKTVEGTVTRRITRVRGRGYYLRPTPHTTR
jgi:hypothetical protein